jgi:N-sulfoglucosamine sulfohydrolase
MARLVEPSAIIRALWALALIAGLVGGGPACARAAAPPNVLFITVDDMGWDSIGVYGSPVPDVTPHIDRLASQGLRFEHAHVNIAICQPSRAVFMTGLYPHRSGATGFGSIRAGTPTLFERLSAAGYGVGIMSKVDHTTPSRRAAWDFVVTVKMLNGGRDPALYYQHARAFFAESKRSGKPFFLVVNIDDPHFPFAGTAAEQSFVRHRLRGFTGAPPPPDRHYAPGEVAVPGFLPDLPPVRASLGSYFDSVHRADESVGRILQALDDESLADSTLVVFVSDNGMHFPFAKTNVYPSSTRTPWIVRWPGTVAAGAYDRRHVISAVDFAPTILEAAGLPALEDTDGRSLLPLLRGEAQEGREYAFTFLHETIDERRYPMRAVQRKRFIYIYNAWSDGRTRFRNRTEGGQAMRAMRKAAKTDSAIAARLQFLDLRTPEELYDHASDSSALHNLIDAPSERDRIARMRELLRASMEASGDPLLERFEEQIRKRPIVGDQTSP